MRRSIRIEKLQNCSWSWIENILECISIGDK
jgi:hypothetical protein